MTSHEVLETKEARSTSRQDLVADILAADHLKLLGALDLMRTIPGGGVEGFEVRSDLAPLWTLFSFPQQLNSPDLKRNLEQLSEQTLGQLHGFLHDGSQPLTMPSSHYPVPGPSNVADNASPTPSASPLPTPTFPPAMPYHHHPMYAYPQHVYQPYSNPYAFANYVPAPIQSNYERNGELIAKPRTKRQYRKKSPPASCVGCDATDTPEWRRGPTGPRTLYALPFLCLWGSS